MHDDTMTHGEIILSTAEYIELTRKALKYDLLKKNADNSNYLTDFERAVFEIYNNEVTKNVDA